MKTSALLFFSLSVMLFACSTEEGIKNDSPLWGIEFSNPNASTSAMGTIDKQNEGPRVTYVAKAGNLKLLQDRTYLLTFDFESGDHLELTVTKNTTDYNYHYPGTEAENQLLSATFNGQPLTLTSSAVSIQPRTEENKFFTVTNLHTYAGEFNGNVGRVPLVK